MRRRLGHGLWALAGLVLAAALAGCEDEVATGSGSLAARIGAEPACALKVRSVQFSVRTDGAPAFARSFPVLSSDDLPIDVAIDIPSPPGAQHEAEAVFTLVGAAPSTPIDPTVVVRFAGGTRGPVPLVLRCPCIGVTCAPGETCAADPAGSSGVACQAPPVVCPTGVCEDLPGTGGGGAGGAPGTGGGGGAGGSPPLGLCPCAGVENNFCQHAPNTADCPMTMPGGYCDPNGDGSYVDGDWPKGYYDYAAACAP